MPAKALPPFYIIHSLLTKIMITLDLKQKLALAAWFRVAFNAEAFTDMFYFEEQIRRYENGSFLGRLDTQRLNAFVTMHKTGKLKPLPIEHLDHYKTVFNIKEEGKK